MDQLELAGAPLAWFWLFMLGSIIAAPKLIQGLIRRGSGVRDSSFLIQRAPQLAAGLVFPLAMISFETIEFTMGTGEPAFGKPQFEAYEAYLPWASLAMLLPHWLGTAISWMGVVLTAVGAVLLISGLYTLRESFSTDAEILPEQALCQDGPYRFVLHPIYAGWVHFLLGTSIVSLSPIAGILVLTLVAPLFIHRAKHEEEILKAQFGATFEQFAASRHWRRIIPLMRPVSR